ncbi:MAG: hypothetical protein M3Z09_16410 [Acidobacteriota bacterium]|nr:hypothetical protein [Acidobacteriota bacterium]
MNHPAESNLALYAGGDLPLLQRWRTDRHVRNCGSCQSAVAEFSELRAFPSSDSVSNWSRLASEMQANIRLGLAAGECVVMRTGSRSVVSGRRLAVVGGLLTVLLFGGIWTQRSVLVPALLSRQAGETVLEAAESGIQVREGRQTLRILNRSKASVSYSVGSQGELRARSLDPETGNVTITHVYGE